jgi:hypothetical protein
MDPTWGNGVAEWLVVGEQCKRESLQHVLEMADSRVYPEKFPVES